MVLQKDGTPSEKLETDGNGEMLESGRPMRSRPEGAERNDGGMCQAVALERGGGCWPDGVTDRGIRVTLPVSGSVTVN